MWILIILFCNPLTTEFSVDYTDTSISVNDATIVNESLRKLRDREADNLTDSTVTKTQGTPKLLNFYGYKGPVKDNTEFIFHATIYLFFISYLYYYYFCIGVGVGIVFQ